MNRLFLFLLLLLPAGALPAREGNTSALRQKVNPPLHKEKFHVYLLAGQSNMAGRGIVEPQDTAGNPRILRLNRRGDWEIAREPLHFDKSSAGVGPGLSFAREMLAGNDDITIGLIPCAAGGSGIDFWKSGAFWEQTLSYPYDDALVRTRLAMKDGVLKGIIWHQGENDCDDPALRASYREKFLRFVAALRHDLNAPNAPFLAGELAPFSMNEPGVADITRVFHDVKAEIPLYDVVSSSGLRPMPDGVHFDAASERELGKRYAAKMKALQTRRTVSLKDGYFRNEDGSRYFPFGFFGCYFRDNLAEEQLGSVSHHGDRLLEFQRMPKSVWRKFFQHLKSQGYTAIRMFPRGDSSISAWEGLDIGGRVNHPLLQTMFNYFDVAAEYGIKVQLCLFSQMECSFYCQPDTRRYWGIRLYTPEEIAAAPPHQRRFLQHPDDLVSYNDYFSDPDVIACNKQFLDEIIPLIQKNPNVFMVELSNELGWAGPHATPSNTFRWEITDQYLAWTREMVEHIHRLAPDLPVCLSNPGVGVLGHDPVQWYRETGVDVFSMHIYPEICGAAPGSDHAQIADISLRYTQSVGTSMYGEWQLIGIEDEKLPGVKNGTMTRDRYEQLMARDITWFTMLSGAPGCISWRAPSFGEYAMVREVFEGLDGRELSPAADELKISIAPMVEKMIALARNGHETCQLTEHRWCPDHSATDGKHRFCAKMESDEYRALLNIESWSLETGAGFTLTQGTDGTPLTALSRKDFLKRPVPLKMPDGYQAKTMRTADGRTILIYLRNYQKAPVMQTDATPAFEWFALRSQSPVPLTLHFTLDDRYELKILDLDTRQWMDARTVSAKSSVGLGISSHDYVLVLTR